MKVALKGWAVRSRFGGGSSSIGGDGSSSRSGDWEKQQQQ